MDCIYFSIVINMTISTSDSLAALNSATLGTNMPVVTLPDGSKVQTGTVGALLINIREYNRLLSEPIIDETRKKELECEGWL